MRWVALVHAARAETAAERLRVAASSDRALSELVESVENALSRDAAIAEIDDRALELDRVLDVGASIPISAARISMFTGTACAIVVVASTRADPSALGAAVASFGIGLTGGMACVVLGRLASVRVRDQRAAWGRLSRSLETALPAE